MFQREFRKLQDLARRVERRGGEDGRAVALPTSGPVLGRSDLGGFRETASSLPPRPDKEETLRQMRRILRDTAALTHTLRQQLEELRSKGWNQAGVQELPPPASEDVMRGMESLGLFRHEDEGE